MPEVVKNRTESHNFIKMEGIQGRNNSTFSAMLQAKSGRSVSSKTAQRPSTGISKQLIATDKITSHAKQSAATLPPPESAPKNNRNKEKGTSVTFATRSEGLIISSCYDMSDHLRSKLWRTSLDIKDNQDEIVKTAVAVRSGQYERDDDTTCTRGLEYIINPAAHHRQQTRKANRLHAVLDVQDEEWQKGEFLANPDLLRAVAFRHSEEDRAMALERAEADETFCLRMRSSSSKARAA